MEAGKNMQPVNASTETSFVPADELETASTSSDYVMA
jgi:hypothetical protein